MNLRLLITSGARTRESFSVSLADDIRLTHHIQTSAILSFDVSCGLMAVFSSAVSVTGWQHEMSPPPVKNVNGKRGEIGACLPVGVTGSRRRKGLFWQR